jgi:hypothetical protein
MTAQVKNRDWTPQSIIRRLPVPLEFCLVISICFGLNILAIVRLTIYSLWPQGTATHPGGPLHITDGNIVYAIVKDLLILGIVFWIARIRKWSFAAFGFRISWNLTGAGLALFCAFQLIQHFLGFLTRDLFHGKVDFHTASQATIPFIILISIVNPVFEETIEVGYFFRAIQGGGMWLTVLSSAAFRGFLHLIMGVSGFVFMFVEGLLHGFFYWRCRQLWPLIVAHGLQMLYSMLSQMK